MKVYGGARNNNPPSHTTPVLIGKGEWSSLSDKGTLLSRGPQRVAIH